MGVHAAFRLAGGARGVRHDGQVVGAGPHRVGCVIRVDHVLPGDEPFAFKRHARGRHERRHCQVGGRAQPVAVGRDDDALQAWPIVCGLSQQRLHLRQQFLRHEGHRRAGIGHVVTQLIGPVHRVDRHDHRVGAQDPVVGEHPLGAVLHVEQHAVAGLYVCLALQPACDALGVASKLGKAERRVVENDERLVRKARRRHLHVVEEMRLRQREMSRQPRRPVRKVGPKGNAHGVMVPAITAHCLRMVIPP